MNIPRFAINNKHFTVTVFLMLVVVGVFTLLRMPKSEDPFFPVPTYGIVTIYPGTNPKDMENLIVEPLEKSLNELEDIDKITTKVSDGVAVTTVFFNQNVDEERKYDEVIRQVNIAKGKLPDNIAGIDIFQASTSHVNIVQYALVGNTMSFDRLHREADRFEKEISKVKGIKKTEISASPLKEVRIDLDINRMASRGIPLTQVCNAIQSTNANIPGGFTDIGRHRLNIVTTGSYSDLDEVKKTIVSASNGTTTYLSDIADVSWGTEELTHTARLNGSRCVFISANQQAKTNIFDVVGEVNTRAEAFKATLPQGMTLEKIFDQSESVNQRLDHLYRDFLIAIVLVLVTLLPLGTRASLTVLVAVPTSLVIGVVFLNVSGMSLNQLSIVGFIVALGLLVDDSIIVVENIVRFIRSGAKKSEAAVKATNQLSLAVLGVTAVIVLSFLPLVTMGGAIGDFFRSFPLAVIFTVIGSLAVSMSLTPILAQWILKDEMPAHGNKFTQGVESINENVFLKILRMCLAHPKWTIGIALGLSVLGFALIPVIGVTGFPSAEKRQFFVNIKLPIGSSLSATDSVSRMVERELRKCDEVAFVAENIGKGNPRIYYNLLQKQQKSNFAQLFVELKNYDRQKTPLLYEELRTKLSRIPDVTIEVKEFIQGTPVDSPIEIFLLGENLDTLETVAGTVEHIMKSVPGAIDVDNPLSEKKSDISIVVNKDKAGMYGVVESEIDKTVRMAFVGLRVGDFVDENGDAYRILVSQDGASIANALEKLDHLSVSSVTGAQVLLKNLVDVQFKQSPSTIEHRNRNRSVTLSANTAQGFLTERVTDDILARLESVPLPAGYHIEVGGEKNERSKNFSSLGGALFVALFGIIAILILEFKTIRGVLIVASAIPLGIFGAVVALWALGYSFSITAFIGIITLIGLEVKNTIISVDFTNQMRAEGHSIDEAIQIARKERFMPILLTTLTATCGLIPLVLERSLFYSPLAVVIIGGLLSSFFLTRFLEPVLYKTLMK
ncbi:MAG TPA: efflux RND transporter permease subunit [Bacteroidota bacterium]|nr:efflux RND transporter permease subunit [Bacteroidota bacterium]